jgi:uncharacterized protein YceK
MADESGFLSWSGSSILLLKKTHFSITCLTLLVWLDFRLTLLIDTVLLPGSATATTVLRSGVITPLEVA